MLLEELSRGLMLPIPLIKGLVNKASHSYKTYTIPKKDGGQRTIHHPSKKLKSLQRWLTQNIINEWPVHDAAYAYRKGRNVASHARAHVDSSYLLRMDLVDFFPSITSQDVEMYLNTNPPGTNNWTAEDIGLFSSLVCRYSKLTIGAPSSPSTSNSICILMDSKLDGFARELGVTFTRYADDLFFSTREPDVLEVVADGVQHVLETLDYPSGLRLNHSKTRHSSKRGRRQVTGIVLGSDEQIHLGRDRKRYIRRQLNRYDMLSPEERAELQGLLAFAMDVEPDALNSFIIKYGRDVVEKARAAEAPS